jgi:prepilin-type N-terminal cleavage/methylation domain-containing protein
MRKTRHGGFTLVELMTAIALTVVLTGSMAGLVGQARNGAARSEEQARELAGFRRALRQLGADLRAARQVRAGPQQVTIETATGTRVWSLRGSTLYRATGGVDEAVARAVSEIAVEPAGELHRVRLRVGVGSVLRTAALPRIEAGR